MPKLAKNCYRTAKGEKRINCYMANIPKEVLRKTNIMDDDEINIYAENNRVIIEKKIYDYVCMGCGYEWETDEKERCCPRCKVGDIYCDNEEENNDYQKQGTKTNA